jgi:uncharacterized protein YbaP (TraB family)
VFPLRELDKMTPWVIEFVFKTPPTMEAWFVKRPVSVFPLRELDEMTPWVIELAFKTPPVIVD